MTTPVQILRTPFRVRLLYRGIVKVRIILHPSDWASMDAATKVIFHSFPEAERMMNNPLMRLSVTYKNGAGDVLMIENDADLISAAWSAVHGRDEYYALQLDIGVIRGPSPVATVRRSTNFRTSLECGQRGDDPLYALQSLVLRLEEGTTKNELTAIVNRLVNQRPQLQN